MTSRRGADQDVCVVIIDEMYGVMIGRYLQPHEHINMIVAGDIVTFNPDNHYDLHVIVYSNFCGKSMPFTYTYRQELKNSLFLVLAIHEKPRTLALLLSSASGAILGWVSVGEISCVHDAND